MFIHASTMLTPQRLRCLVRSAAELGFVRSVKTECAALTLFFSYLRYGHVFLLTSLTSQNSPSEPVLLGFGNVPKRRAAGRPATLFFR